jgi:hypothetical protein
MKSKDRASRLRYRIFGGILLLFLLSPAARAQLQFSSPANYAVGSSPGQVVTGDFNGDGKQDMAVLNTGDQTISILLGNGDGTFQAAKSQATGSTATGLAAGDFNGDGKLDLVLANGSANTVSVMLGNGDGTFQAPVQYNIGSSADFVAVGDFNNDQKLDLLLATSGGGGTSNPTAGSMAILLGNGDGTFQAAKTTSTGSYRGTTAYVAVGDFNGDGDLDVSTGDVFTAPRCLPIPIPGSNCVNGHIIVFLGKGDGTFESPVTSTVDFGVSSLVTGDFNGDGKIDLALNGWLAITDQFHKTNHYGVIATVLGKGDGTFNAPTWDATPTCGGCEGVTNVAVADLNGDGKPDLLVPGAPLNYPNVDAYLGNGDGTFQPAQQFNLATVPSWLTVGDFSGVTLADFVMSNSSANDVSVFLNGAPGVTLSVTLTGSGGGTVTSQSGTLNCTNSCSGQFAPGTMVTLTAAPNAASDFTGWSGACSGTGTCSVTMTSSVSVTATFGVPPPDFSITPASASLTGQRGGQASDVITLAPLNGEAFGSPIQLSCKVTGSTPLATCDFSSASVTPGAKSATSTLMVTVPTESARLLQNGEGKLEGALRAVFLPLPVITFLGLGLTRGKRMERRRGLWLMYGLLIAFAALQIGCGGGSATQQTTPPPLNYTVTVTATSGAIQHTTQVTVTVP